MALDVIDLRNFYGSGLGLTTRKAILNAVRGRWETVNGLAVLGIGYATPYLDALRDEAERTIALMPGQQGIVAWPQGGLSAAGLVDPVNLPMRDSVFDRILVVHALETSEDPQGLLEELGRVLTPGGHIIVVAPNRRGAWSRRDTTPFGTGQPFSRRQLTEHMRNALLTPVHWTEALYVPPTQNTLVLKSAGAFERVGAALGLPFAGVHIIEAIKQVYRPVLSRRGVKAGARLAPVLVPSTGRDQAI